MSYQYIYERSALNEYKEAILWYKERSEIASKNFITAIKERLHFICEDPMRYRNLYKYFRETSLKTYPYSVVYFIDEINKLVIVSSIYHHKRNPKKKYQK